MFYDEPLDKINDWIIFENEGIFHAPCEKKGGLPYIDEIHATTSLRCNNCNAFLNKSILIYFILAYPGRNWNRIDLERYRNDLEP